VTRPRGGTDRRRSGRDDGRTRRQRRWAALAAVAWTAGLFALSSWSPGDGALDVWWRFPHDDKVVHGILYAVLGGLLRVATGRVLAAVTIAGGVGIADELYQATVPGRTADPLDWLADVLGALAGAALVTALPRRGARDRVTG
jgi:peptidoglycan/LPS O-acetylase OafA/YrhL